MSSYSPHASGSQPSDDWAFEFINAKYLQPIMEAFDDDGSGYVTYQEVNEFVEERPAELGWRYIFLLSYKLRAIHLSEPFLQPPALGSVLGCRMANHRWKIP